MIGVGMSCEELCRTGGTVTDAARDCDLSIFSRGYGAGVIVPRTEQCGEANGMRISMQ
jgi:hypothetical protein